MRNVLQGCMISWRNKVWLDNYTILLINFNTDNNQMIESNVNGEGNLFLRQEPSVKPSEYRSNEENIFNSIVNIPIFLYHRFKCLYLSEVPVFILNFFNKYFINNSSVLLFLIGTFSAILSWCFDEILELALHLKYITFNELEDTSYILFLFSYLMFNILSVNFAIFLTNLISSKAIGSGIPQIKSLLAGYDIENYLSLKTLFAKILGLFFALLGSLVIGTEGPFLHISCILGYNLCFLFKNFEPFRTNQTLKKQLLSAASAVGVTSSFGTPIGGVLFSIEVTSNFYYVEEYWKAFFCSVFSTLVFKELSKFGQTRKSVVSLFATNFKPLPYTLFELPLFILISFFSGLLGGFFILSFKKISKISSKFKNSYLLATFVVFLTLVLNLIGGSLMYLPLRIVISDLFSSQTAVDSFSEGRHLQFGWFLTEKEKLDFEKDLTVSSSNVTEDLNWNWNWGSFTSFSNLLIYSVLKSVLTIFSLNLDVPCGLFTPVFVIGAALGRFFGEFLLLFFNEPLAAGYAVVGAASFTAGVTGTVSTAVIVFELTSQLSYMIPVLLAVLIGRSSALLVTDSYIYDCLSMMRGLKRIPTLRKREKLLKTVGDCYEPIKDIENSFRVLERFMTDDDVRKRREQLKAEKAEINQDNIIIEEIIFAVIDSKEKPYFLCSLSLEEFMSIDLKNEINKENQDRTIDWLKYAKKRSIRSIECESSLLDFIKVSFAYNNPSFFFTTRENDLNGIISMDCIN